MNIAVIFLRTALGLLVLATGIGKLLDLRGFARVLETYELGFGGGSLLALAVGVTVYEVILGAWLISGWRVRASALVNAVTSLGYVVVLSATLMRGLELSNCGCFGVFLARPLTWSSPLEDVALVALSLALFRVAQRRDAARAAAAAGARAQAPAGGVTA